MESSGRDKIQVTTHQLNKLPPLELLPIEVLGLKQLLTNIWDSEHFKILVGIERNTAAAPRC